MLHGVWFPHSILWKTGVIIDSHRGPWQSQYGSKTPNTYGQDSRVLNINLDVAQGLIGGMPMMALFSELAS